MKQRKLILRSFLSPGDITMLTAAVRDLHRCFPSQFITDVDTSCGQLWENNPYITKLDWKKENNQIITTDKDIEIIECHYDGQYAASINRSNTGAFHFIHGYAQDLGKQLGLYYPITEFKGDVHISNLEKSWMNQIEETGEKRPFWIIVAGGKNDFTNKIWNHERYQKVVDYFKGKILFVQVGAPEHVHKPLEGVINLLGKTDLRQFVRLMYHADGVICPVTFAMHLAAATPVKQGKPLNRACVVIAGGREPAHWEAYPHHRFLSNNGALRCCDNGGCWKSRIVPLPDGDEKNNSLCLQPTDQPDGTKLPRCLDMITADDVIRAVESYFIGGSHKYI